MLNVRKEFGSLQQVIVACTENQNKHLQREESRRTPQCVQPMQNIIDANYGTSMRAIDRDLEMSEVTMHNMVQDHIRYKSNIRQ